MSDQTEKRDVVKRLVGVDDSGDGVVQAGFAGLETRRFALPSAVRLGGVRDKAQHAETFQRIAANYACS